MTTRLTGLLAIAVVCLCVLCLVPDTSAASSDTCAEAVAATSATAHCPATPVQAISLPDRGASVSMVGLAMVALVGLRWLW